MDLLTRCVLGCLVLSLPNQERGPDLPKIDILEGDWGEADRGDIQAVCRSVAQELLRYFPSRRRDPITVRPSTKGPMVIFGKGDAGERRVLLDVKDRYWAQFAFQFAHELGHILANYREADRSNLWFEEALCETASLFALRRMSETWKTRPPNPGWKDFAPALARYAADRITRVPVRATLGDWYRENEAALRTRHDDRDRNQVAAVGLLALLEKDPARWRSVGWLNLGDGKKGVSFREYLADWHRRVPKEEKPFVASVARLFEIALP